MPEMPSILIVDDQVDNLKVLFNTLKQDYQVRVASSGAEALTIVRQFEAPDLFLLDIMMPAMDGYALCRRLKSLPGIHETPVIFLTARDRPEDEELGFAVGAVDYITKPMNARLVQTRIKAQLALASQIKQARQAECALAHRHQSLANILWGTGVGTWEWNVQTGEARFDERWAEMIGYRLEELAPITIETWWSVVHPEDLPVSQAMLERHFAGELDYYEVEVRMRHRSGDWIWVLDRGRVITRTEGQPLWMAGTHLDITAHKQAELAVKQTKRLLQAALESSPLGILIAEAPERKIRFVNHPALEILGLASSSDKGHWDGHLNTGWDARWKVLRPDGQPMPVQERPLTRAMTGGETVSDEEAMVIGADGTQRCVSVSAAPIYDEEGRIGAGIVVFSDISAHKENQLQWKRSAHYDALTDLPNRVLLNDRLEQAMARARRSGQPLAVAFIDLDRFKPVNDQYGHAAGDQLLVTLAQRMRACLRDMDTLARLGGDEFVVVFSELTYESDARVLVERLLAVLSSEVVLDDARVRVGGSIGLTFYPQRTKRMPSNCCIRPIRPCTRPSSRGAMPGACSRVQPPRRRSIPAPGCRNAEGVSAPPLEAGFGLGRVAGCGRSLLRLSVDAGKPAMTGRTRAATCAPKRLAFALLLLFASSLASGINVWAETPAASAAIPLSAEQRAWLEAHPDIVLGASDQFAPSLIRDPDGRLTGVLKEILDLLNQRLGTDIRLQVSSSWADISEQALAGQVDGLMAVARLPLWLEHFLLTETFIKGQVYLFVGADETLVGEGVDGLRDQRVGVLRGHQHINGLLSASANALELERVPYDDYQAMAAALLSGKIDRVVAASTFEWWRRKQSLMGFEIATVWEEGEYEGVLAIRKDWPELVEILNLGLASISSAERAAIYNRWLGSVIDATPASALEPVALSTTERDWLQAHPEILLGISDQFQPDVIVGPDGRQSGLVVDLIERLNEPLGGRLKLHIERDWSEVTRKAKARAIDGLASSAPNPVWDQHFLYTDPLYKGFFSLYRRVDDPPLRDREALVGLRVGYLAGMRKIETLLADLPDLTLVPLVDHPAMAKALIDAEVDVLVGSIDLEWWRRQHSSLAFGPTGILAGSEHPVVMSIRNDWPELVGILNKALRAIPTAERTGIEQRWLGASPTQTTAPRLKLSSAARKWLEEHSRIRFAVSRDWAPVDFYDSQDRPAGIAPDYLERIGEMLDLQFEPVPIDDWPEAMEGLQQGRIDLLPAATPTPERERDFLFTEPYLEFPIAIFAPVQTPLIDRLSSLHGQRVIVIEGHAIQHWLQVDHPDIRLVPVRDARSAARALAQGQGEALIGNLFAISQAIAYEKLFQLRVAGETSYSYQLAMAVRPDWQPLLAILEQALTAIPPAEREAIQSRWLRALPPERLDARLLWQVALGAALVLTVILLWNLSLRREIARRRSAERSLAASEQRYRGMVESARSVLQFYSLDGQGVLLDVSAGSREFFGMDDRDMLGKHWGEIAAWSPDTIERIEQGLATCWRGQVPAPVTLQYELHGESRYLLSFASPVKDDNHRVVRVEGLSVNLTERLRLEEALRELESDLYALIEHAPLPMLVADSASAQAQLINQRFRSLIGYRLEEIKDVNHWWSLAYPDPDYRRQISTEWQQQVERALATDGLIGPMEAGIVCADGQTRTFLGFSVILNKRYLVMFVDITEQRATEARLRAAQEKAEAANRAKSEFLANMSHEIRTPMNAILGMQSLCLDGALNEGKRDYLLTAQNAAKTLLGLLNDLLDLSKIEAGQLRLDAHPFALSQVLDPLHTMMMPLAEEKGLEVVIDCPPEVPETLYGDALRLSQILLNLANNAVKFTEQGAIHIEARLLERLPAEPDAARERVHLEFRVRDTGIGLSEEQSALLFQPFHQADGSITRRYGGTGLGLSICKRLALMMDGAIGVNSQLGEGSTFWFTLWLQCPLPGERPARGTSLCLAQAPPELAGRRVLLVEDNAFNREVARILLERAGLSVSEAEQGVAALAQLREQGCAAFDLVLMDIQMPEMDGLEATQRIRALPDGRRLPIIGLTAHVRDKDVARARAAGMDAHLGKPFEPARLYGLLADQLGLALQALVQGISPSPSLDPSPSGRRRRSICPPLTDSILQRCRSPWGLMSTSGASS